VTPEALAALHARCFTVPKPFSAAAFESLLAPEYSYVCTLPHGFALGRTIAGEAELLTLAVDPDRRRHGTGRALLIGFEAEAMARGADRAFLEVAANNAPAIGLYRASGYTESGRRHAYYREPDSTGVAAILMTKPLFTA